MSLFKDPQVCLILGTLFGVLILASLIGWLLSMRAAREKGKITIANLNARVRAWWIMIGIFVVAAMFGPGGSIILFAIISLLALREYLALSPTLRNDHRVLLWMIFVILPLNYGLIAIRWYGLFVVFIPVYAFIWIQVRAALAGATQQFLDRTARLQWGMMVTIYFVSYIPALQLLDIPNYSAAGQNFKLILFLIIVTQASDVLQYVTGKLFGRHLIAPNVSPNKTIEGCVGGFLLATILGASLFRITPFSVIEAGVFALVICLMGFAGGLIMSSMKRDRNVKDFGTLLPGHGGILDRIDSLCFAAPIFFHLTRYFS